MNRSVKNLGWAVAVGALMLVACGKKRVSRDESATTTEEKTDKVAKGEPGITDETLVLAQTAVFNGPNTSWGADTWRGSAALFSELNAKGGIHGRKIEVRAVDDGYDTPRAMANVKAYIEKNDFFVLFNFVGSNVMIETAKELENHKDKNIFEFASIASTSVYRKSDRAFSVRAPISLEMKQAVDAFVAAGKKKIAVFHQDDAYGKSGLDGVTAALEAHGLKPVAVAKHAVQQKFEEAVKTQVDLFKAAGAEAVFDIGNYQAAAALVRDTRESGWDVPIVSNASINDAFLRVLLAHEKKAAKKIAFNLVGVKVVPSPEEKELPLIRDYRELIDKRNPKTPPELTDPNFRQNTYAFQQVEGFVNAKILAEILQRMGPKPTRAKFKETAESLKNFDIGLGPGAAVTFGPDDHTALDKVWLYYVKDGDWVTLKDLGSALSTSAPAAQAKATPAKK